MNRKPIRLLAEQSQIIKIKDLQINIKHNYAGFTIDIYIEAPLDNILLREEEYYFEDLNYESELFKQKL